PQAMTVVEQPGGAHVTWQPPAHDGGRRITSYRVMADTGMSVSVDHATGAVDLPIPAMAPGRVVPVTVQAWTGLGWGEAATMSFTSTQTTPFTALTYADPGPEDPDPEDPDPENPDPENPDPEVPGPVDPGDPGTPG